ncbi:MAG: hypothetical protein RIR39_1537, partial [Pseudomonadota bacterium]
MPKHLTVLVLGLLTLATLFFASHLL